MINYPKGFRGGALAAGLKSSGAPDLAMIVNDGRRKASAAVFTKNKIQAAPVIWSRQVIKDGEVAAALLNSGGANACTGSQGFLDTHKSAEAVAEHLKVSASDVFICSTGMIGLPLPMDLMKAGISKLSSNLKVGDIEPVARAIMTTDSVPKMASYQGDGWSIVGIAKGAGMLAPSLATMLVVIMTDLDVDSLQLDTSLRRATELTFDRIDSDGCMSTNDTVLLMASGESQIAPSPEEIDKALTQVCRTLAVDLISDAEGHTKVIEIETAGAHSETDALEVGRSIARNNLLKCAINGEDPNWGRILAAIGTTTATFDPLTIDVSINGVKVCRDSSPGEPRELVDMTSKNVKISIDLKSGRERATVWTNDLSAMYVHENSAYST